MGQFYLMESDTKSIHVDHSINKAMKKTYTKSLALSKIIQWTLMFCASDGPWGLSCISHVQNPLKSTSGFPGAEGEVSRGHSGESVFAWVKEIVGERNWGQEPSEK